MANDDWRIRIELEEEQAHGLLQRMQHGLSDEAAELAKELRNDRLAVSRDGNTIFVYADTRDQARKAHAVVEAELAAHGHEAAVSSIEQWLQDEERWSGEPPGETWEEEVAERGFAPWEVRIPCPTAEEAETLAGALAGDGYAPLRRGQYLIVGVATEEEAQALAARTKGEAEPGGEIVWEAYPHKYTPFAIFG